MKKFLLSLVFGISLFAEDFLLQEEYVQMFYLNPRGISCAKCHGVQGQGLTLTQYQKKGRKFFIEAPNIQNASFLKLKKALKNDKKSLMPSYDLTDNEIMALEQYLAQFINESKINLDNSKE